MRFRDTMTNSVYTLTTLWRDYKRFSAETPTEYPHDFTTELISIIVTTRTGFNHLEIIDKTRDEIDRFLYHLCIKSAKGGTK